MIPQDFPSCYYSSMRNLAVLVIHLIATLARLLGPGGVRSLVAESLLLKHQLLIVNRSPTTIAQSICGGTASLPACWRSWCVQPAFSVPDCSPQNQQNRSRKGNPKEIRAKQQFASHTKQGI
jgi:hypothetical protein